ncbi:hypothetical protein ZEAMMB73_Zm00001d044400 [Zea mays]|uniref:DUF7895 domain-containing protein n=1 Tax=Zea mays TaxID=4577 RepID=A0A1D6NLF5_MAIZE|nr:hypothetical protein ZEAMMB73_Zm00001d044400 [Zea mays]
MGFVAPRFLLFVKCIINEVFLLIHRNGSCVSFSFIGTVDAACLLIRSSSPSIASRRQHEEREEQVEGEECPDCGGTGLYIRCKGECFVFKQLSKETATRHARPPRTWPPDTLQGYPPMDLLQKVLLHPRACIKWKGFYQQSTHM